MANGDLITKPIFIGDGLPNKPLTPQGYGIQPAQAEASYEPVKRSPLIDPPDASWPFAPDGEVTIPAIGSSVIVCQQTVPKGHSAVIWRMANGSNFSPGISGWINGSGSLLWKILHNGQVYQFFNARKTIFGLTENGGSELVAPLRGQENETLALVLYNVSLNPAGQISVGLLSGYIFPKSLDPARRR